MAEFLSRWIRQGQNLSRIGFVGLAMLAVVVILALFPARIAPYDPTETVARPLHPPSDAHPLGTNDVGQDLFSELVWGTRISLLIGVSAATLGVGTGVLNGVIAAYFGGLVDTLVMRVVDLMLVIPVFPLLLLIAIYMGPGLLKIIFLIGLLSWANPARIFRAQTLAVRGSDYITAARAIGAPHRRIVTRHLMPAVLPLAVGQFALMVSQVILVEAGLSFLGLGDPTQKSWGTMLYFAQASGASLTRAWRWWVLPTGVMISLTTLGFAFVGHALEEWLDPTLKR